MALIFNYTISTDTLNGAVATKKLTNEIRAEDTILVALEGVSDDGVDGLTIEFRDNLTTANETTLDAIVAAHDGNPGLDDAGLSRVVGADQVTPVSVVDDSGVKRFAVDLSDVLTGPEGPEGPAGPQGPPGPAGIFGSEFQYDESLGESSTTSSSWQNKLTFNTTSLPSGNYYVVASAEVRNSSDEAAAMARFRVDGVTVGENGMNVGDDSPNNFEPFYAQDYLTSISGVKTLTIDFREQSGGTARIRRAKITIWRVS